VSRPDTRSPLLNGWVKAIAGLFISIVLLFGVAEPAMAAVGVNTNMAATSHSVASANISAADTNGDGFDDNTGISVVTPSRGVCSETETMGDGLPVGRWQDAMEFHDRLHNSRPGDIAKSVQRQGVVSLLFATGNMFWSVTTGATEMAVNFCVLNKVGGLVDNVAATLAHAMISSNLLAVLVVCSVIFYAWRIGRGQGGSTNTSALLQKGIVLGVFGIMLAGASASTGGGSPTSPKGDYHPGAGSPGWFVTEIDTVVSQAANIGASGLANHSIHGAEYGVYGNENLACAPYVAAMKNLYRDNYGKTEADKANAAVPLLLSSMWENSGLEMWKNAQFGNAVAGNAKGTYSENYDWSYGDVMYCHLLDYNASTPRHPTTGKNDSSVTSVVIRANHILNGNGKGGVGHGAYSIWYTSDGDNKTHIDDSDKWEADGNFLAWRYSNSNKWRDRAWVGWAGCAAPADGKEMIHAETRTDSALVENCKNFFQKAEWDGGGGQDEFDWDESNDDITDTDVKAPAEDFLLHLHGSSGAGGGLISGFIYMISAAVTAAVFVTFSGAIMVAKTGALMMMLTIFFVLAMTLAPNTSMSKVADFAKQYAGMSFFAWGAQLIMSLIALMTGILVQVGNEIAPGGRGSVMAVAWVGFAPVIACICLHMIFKKMRIPSPMKVSGGMAWGKLAAGGAVAGAGAAGGSMLMSKLGDRTKRAAANTTKKTMGKMSGNERGNRMALKDGSGSKSPSEGGTASPSGTSDGEQTSVPIADPNSYQGKAQQARLDSQEHKAAKDFAKTDEGKKLLDEQAKAKAAQSGKWNHVKDRAALAKAQFQEKPLRTTLKYGAIGAGAFVAGGTALGGLGAIAVPAAALAVGRSGIRKAGSGVRADMMDPTGRGRRNAEIAEAYRTHKAGEGARKEVAAQREQDRLGLAFESTSNMPKAPTAEGAPSNDIVHPTSRGGGSDMA
jgi:hypothetical protein